MGIKGESDNKFLDFIIIQLREGFVIGDRCSQLKISKFKSQSTGKIFEGQFPKNLI